MFVWCHTRVSSDQNRGYLMYVYIYKGLHYPLQYIGIGISHCTDPYRPDSIMECQPRVLLPLLMWLFHMLHP